MAERLKLGKAVLVAARVSPRVFSAGSVIFREGDEPDRIFRIVSGRAVRDKHVPRYLAEFEYRFNRRYDTISPL